MQKKSSKKTSQRTKKRAVRRVPAALRARALAIINSNAYDDDSREGIRNVLNERTSDLSDLIDYVQRVEDGETFCDMAGAGRKRQREAQIIFRFLQQPITRWLREAFMDALQGAAARADCEREYLVRINAREPVDKRLALNSLTQLLILGGGDRNTLRLSERDKVVQATSELLSNPKTPASLFEAVAGFVTETMNRKEGQEELLYSAPMLTVFLDSYQEDELMGAVIAARKEAQS
jgi:hypothetical protein